MTSHIIRADTDVAVAALRSAAQTVDDRQIIHTLTRASGRFDAGTVIAADWDLQACIDFILDAKYVMWVQDPLDLHHLAAAQSDDSPQVMQFRVPLPDGIEFPPPPPPDNSHDACMACNGDHGNGAFDRYLTTVVKPKLAEHGWLVQGVMAVSGSPDDAPGFFYTIGMTPAGLPELLLVGMPHEMAHHVLTAAVNRHLADEIKAGDEVDLDFSVPFRFAAVDDDTTRKLATVARAAFPATTVRALQIMFPDTAGRWPDDPQSEFADMIFTADEVAAAFERNRDRNRDRSR